ncbi:hypothetical protein IPG41_07175 [Candidatus Peregrinibacteria bacterium]|nr:MAG: hypothetical protein IPG41_07175 [Candidatus Peregrinibacteria bacterium]
MKKTLSFAALLLSAGCSLVAPYTLTFTNAPGSVVDPAVSTLDFVVSQPTLAYISKVSCDGAEPLELLPIVDEDSPVSTVHKLPLTLMKDLPTGAACEVTATVFDPTTTETASASIELTLQGEPAVEEPLAEEPLENPEGIENEEPLEPVSEPHEPSPTPEPIGTEEPGA